MKSYVTATAALFCLAAPALADGHASGDPAAGEKAFKQCKSCHMVADGDNVIVKGGKTGPNLYGIAGRTAGTVDGFKYGASLVEAGEKGLVWDAENFAEYTKDPRGFLKTYLDDTSAKSKMSFKLKKGAEDIYAYLESITVE